VKVAKILKLFRLCWESSAVMESRAGNARAARLVLDALLQVSTPHEYGMYTPCEFGTYKTVTAGFWPGLSAESR
jgi:hypothetical protein